MTVFNHQHSKFLNLAAGFYKPAKGSPRIPLLVYPVLVPSFVFKDLTSFTSATHELEEDDLVLSSRGSLSLTLTLVIPVPLHS